MKKSFFLFFLFFFCKNLLAKDKFVYLDRSFKIYCVYNTRFKKWIPVKLAPEESKISSL